MSDGEAPGEWPDAYELASDAVKECAESIVEQRDVDKDTAFAICQDMENQGQLSEPNTETGDTENGDGDGGREAGEYGQPFRALQDHQMDPPGAVRKVEQDDGSVRYTNLLILAPGEWTDAATEETVFYAPDLMQSIAEAPQERAVRTNINLNHESRDQLLTVGNYDPESLQTDAHGNLYADLEFWNDTTVSEDAVALMDRALETEGAQGAGGLSVEIPFENSVEEFDRERGMTKLVAGDLAGIALVTDSASEPVTFEEQFPQRAVAMSSTGDTVRVLESAGETTLTGTRHDGDMSTEEGGEDAEETFTLESDGAQITVKADSVDAIQDAVGDADGVEIAETAAEEEAERDLQGDEELQMVADLIGEFLAENDPDAPASEFVSFVDEQTDADPAELEGVLGAYLESVDADSLEETPVSALQGFVDAQMNDENSGDGETEGGDEEEGEEGEEMGGALEEFRDELRELREENEELRETVDELAEQEAPRMELEAEDEKEDGESGPSPASGSVRERSGWLSR